MKERLYKSTSDRMLSGVSGGLAEYLDVDSTLVRIAWVIVTIMSAGVGFLAYIALVIIVPTRPFDRAPASPDPAEAETLSDVETSSDQEPYPASGHSDAERNKRRRSVVIGVVLVVVGGLALGYNFDLFEWLDWGKFWPALLILLGVLLIVRRFERG